MSLQPSPAQVILHLRLTLNLTQQEFANLLDIPVANISRWEQGQVEPPEYVISLIKRVCELEQDLLYTDDSRLSDSAIGLLHLLFSLKEYCALKGTLSSNDSDMTKNTYRTCLYGKRPASEDKICFEVLWKELKERAYIYVGPNKCAYIRPSRAGSIGRDVYYLRDLMLQYKDCGYFLFDEKLSLAEKGAICRIISASYKEDAVEYCDATRYELDELGMPYPIDIEERVLFASRTDQMISSLDGKLVETLRQKGYLLDRELTPPIGNNDIPLVDITETYLTVIGTMTDEDSILFDSGSEITAGYMIHVTCH